LLLLSKYSHYASFSLITIDFIVT